MIGYLQGKILENSEGKLLVVVGSAESGAGAMGYQVFVPRKAEYELLPAGRLIELFIHTHVREDALDLYGFVTRAEKDLFLTFLSVNGIGPKGALGIISGATASDLINAIVGGDTAYLTRIPGIGKKTAERVVLELAEPIRKKVESGAFANVRPVGSQGQSPQGAGAATDAPEGAGDGSRVDPAMIRDAKAALIGLGFREQEVTALLNRVLADPATRPRHVEDLVRTALRQLSV